MSNLHRAALLLAAVLVVVVVIVLVGGGDDKEEQTRTGAATERAPAGEREHGTPATPERPSTATRISVDDGAPVGGVSKIAVSKGERIRFVVRSDDTRDEVHLHGYDVTRRLAPGAPARFDLPATIEGVFEAELEGAEEQVVSLTVRP